MYANATQQNAAINSNNSNNSNHATTFIRLTLCIPRTLKWGPLFWRFRASIPNSNSHKAICQGPLPAPKQVSLGIDGDSTANGTKIPRKLIACSDIYTDCLHGDVDDKWAYFTNPYFFVSTASCAVTGNKTHMQVSDVSCLFSYRRYCSVS